MFKCSHKLKKLLSVTALPILAFLKHFYDIISFHQKQTVHGSTQDAMHCSKEEFDNQNNILLTFLSSILLITSEVQNYTMTLKAP